MVQDGQPMQKFEVAPGVWMEAENEKEALAAYKKKRNLQQT
jgi:hypothetical protein